MNDLQSILNKHGYSTSNSKDYLYVTQDGTSGFFGFIIMVAAGSLGWYMGKQDPDLKELENDPFITESTFYKILDFIGSLIQWGFIIGAVLVGVFMLYSLYEKGKYQLSIHKDFLKLDSANGSVKWDWKDISSFTIENSSESLFVENSSGEKMKLFEFYSKDKSAIKDLEAVKNVLITYKNSSIDNPN